MAKLRDRIQDGLDETRILVLGTQVLLGIQYRLVFEPRYEDLPSLSKALTMVGLTVLCATLGLLMIPATYHRIVEAGEDTPQLERVIRRVLEWALPFVFVALAINLFVAAAIVRGQALGLAFGLFLGVGGSAWLGWMAFAARRHPHHGGEEQMQEETQPTPVKNKVRHVLTETRVVLPGAQALLGFQFIVMLARSFEDLPKSSQWVHLVSLTATALSVVLLISPAPYHRIVEHGEESEHFQRLAGRFLLAALVPLGLGVAGDFFVVLRKVSGSLLLAEWAAALLLVFLFGLWFGFTLLVRGRQERRRGQPRWGLPRRAGI